MKVVAVLIVTIFATCVRSDEAMMMKVVEGCKATTGASDDDFQKFLSHAPAENEQQKCMFSCVMGGLGVIQNGNLMKEGFTVMAEQLVDSDPYKMSKALEVYEFCGKIEDSDVCEKAAKIGVCMKTEGEKHGLKLSM